MATTAPGRPDSAQAAPAEAGPVTMAWAAMRAGRVRQATVLLTQLARVAADESTSLDASAAAMLATLTTESRLAVGDIAGAAAAADPLSAYATGDDVTATMAALGQGELAAALGDHARALAAFTRAGELPAIDVIRPWRTGAVMALVRTGKRREGAELAHAHMESAADAWSLAVGLRTLAIAEAGRDPIGTLHEAQTLAVTTADRRLQAQVEADLAALMLLSPAQHAPMAAIALLRAAESYAGSEGLWPLHSRVSRLLERAGERPRPLEGEALALLTAAERRVARLAAGGLTNRQIAEHLTVTVKGVEWHLSRVYRKLGVGSRDGLTALLNVDLVG
jgi:DNA-binding CsgD family transcriptional regulator